MTKSYNELTYLSRSKSSRSMSPAVIMSAISSGESFPSCLANSLAYTAFSRAPYSFAMSSFTLRFSSGISGTSVNIDQSGPKL